MKHVFIVVLVLLLTTAGWLTYKLNDRPTLEPYAELFAGPAEPSAGQFHVTWLGVSTVLIDDGKTAIMTDGFFTRPALLEVAATRLAPDEELITEYLERVGVDELAALIVVHSHYDHVMDAPEVTRQTGALLIGSESTINVGRGSGLPEDQMLAIEGGEELQLGKFRITLIRSRHIPHGKLMGDITGPVSPPARASEYLEGGSYALHIEHSGRRLLIQGSAGFIGDEFSDYPADAVLMGIGLLGKQDQAYQSDYWHELVENTGAKRVVPIHWDDFFLPLDEPLEPFPYLLDDFDASMQFIRQRADEQDIDVQLMRAWQRIDPFAGL